MGVRQTGAGGDDGGPIIEGEGDLPLEPGDVISIIYTATVNENAIIGYGTDGAGNTNVASLEYSKDPNNETDTGRTPEETVHVYALGLDLKKVGDDTEHADGLGGAGFSIAWGTDEYALVAKFAAKEDGNYVISEWTDPAEEEGYNVLYETYQAAEEAFRKAPRKDRVDPDSAVNTDLEAAKEALTPYLVFSGEDGRIRVQGLDETTAEDPFVLTEVITPDGYETMDSITFRLHALIQDETGILEQIDYYNPASGEEPAGTYRHDDEDNTVFTSGLVPHELVNQISPFLPNTGGIGLAIVYLVSGMAVLFGIFVILPAMRKKNGLR